MGGVSFTGEPRGFVHSAHPNVSSLIILMQPSALQVVLCAGFLLPFGVEFGPGLNPLNGVSRDLI